jgi:hypothetical protein
MSRNAAWCGSNAKLGIALRTNEAATETIRIPPMQ